MDSGRKLPNVTYSRKILNDLKSTENRIINNKTLGEYYVYYERCSCGRRIVTFLYVVVEHDLRKFQCS